MVITLFDSHLLIPFEDTGPLPRFRQLLLDDSEIGDLLCKSLLYDKVIIPTVDLTIIPLLALWIGPTNLITAIEENHIQIIKYRGAIGYAGGGLGLVLFGIQSNRQGRIKKVHDLAQAPPDEVLSYLERKLSLLEESMLGTVWLDVKRYALRNIIEVDPKEFEQVGEATCREILDNPLLQSYFAIRNKNLKYLKGVDANQLRWCHGRNLNDEVDALLHMAQFNWECYLADKTGAIDQTAGPAAQHLLQTRVERLVGSREVGRSFTEILELNRIADLSIAARDDELFNRIWKLRNTGNAAQFRHWFHENVRRNPQEAQKVFVDSLLRPTLGDNLAFKVVRFIVFNVLPSIIPEAPAISPLASAVDTVLVNRAIRFLSTPTPKLMIDDLRAAFKVNA